jgi:hypothetical protein
MEKGQMTEPSCATCDAFRANVAQNPKAGDSRQGWCCAEPPKLLQVSMPNVMTGQAQIGLQGAWPPTDADKWCRAWASSDG